MNRKLFLGHGFLFLFIFLLLFFYSWNLYWGGERWKGFFLSDANGYYAYLPATFIYHDLTFSFVGEVKEKSFSSFDNFDFRKHQSGSANDQWFCGAALVILPFFLVGHALSMITGGDLDGYSFWYAWAAGMAAIAYCLIGLIALGKILSRFFKRNSLFNLVLILILFATNLFYYSTTEPLMSHVYSFVFINLFVLSLLNFIESKQQRFLFFSFVLLAVVILIRPVNGFCVAIFPFLSGSKEKFKEILLELFRQWKTLIVSVVAFCCILFVQLIYYKLETGSFLIYSYGDVKMNLLNPHLLDFLFSYKKGLFVYLPVIFLSLYGLMFLYRTNKWQFYSVAVFVLLLWWILSSWETWWYGGSFGTRPIIDYLFVFSILLGFAMQGLKGLSKKIFLSFCCFALILCEVQTYQYRYCFIHWDRMTKESYWKVFMRIDLLLKRRIQIKIY